MNQLHEENLKNQPFLMKYASPRTDAPSTPGHYSSELEMWVVDVNGKEQPLIEYDASIGELMTKTDSTQERDDQCNSLLTELVTKTMTQQEQDDENYVGLNSFLELMTKTEALPEHDDVATENISFFL